MIGQRTEIWGDERYEGEHSYVVVGMFTVGNVRYRRQVAVPDRTIHWTATFPVPDGREITVAWDDEPDSTSTATPDFDPRDREVQAVSA